MCFFYTRNSTIVKFRISTWTKLGHFQVKGEKDVIKDLLVVDCRRRIYFGMVIFTEGQSNPFLNIIKCEEDEFERVLKLEKVLIYWNRIEPGIQFWCRDKEDVNIVYLSGESDERLPQKIKGLRLLLK